MRGFTLIESIVALAIIILMSAVTFIGYGDFKARLAVDQAVQKTALDIRKSQNFANVTIALSDGSVPCGYGIHYVDSDTYFLFANVKDGLLDDCSDSNKFYDGNDIVVEEIKIGQQNVMFETSTSPFPDIVFLPPDPVTYINGILNPGSRGTIGLCFNDKCSSIFRRIDVWGTGLVDIE